MASDKKTITKKLKEVVDDIMDNYDRYNDNEKKQVANQMQQLIDLNKSLDKYDPWTTKMWDSIVEAFNNFFGKK